MKRCEDYFNDKEQDIAYLDMFKALFIARDREDIDSTMKEFTSQYIVKNIAYDFKDLLVMADENNLKSLKIGIEFLLQSE